MNTILILGMASLSQTTSILHDMDSTRCSKHSLKILFHVDMIVFSSNSADLSATHSCSKSPVLPHPKGVLLDSDLVTGKATCS